MEFKAEKKVLSNVKKLEKEWNSKTNFTKGLVKKLIAANAVYSKHVKEEKYQKPMPRILNVRHCQFTSSKKNDEIEEVKAKTAEKIIQREEIGK